jgi:UDP-N-acetylglucosamine 2-epimerase (non-hydrolysing)
VKTLGVFFERNPVAAVLVQGDTSSAFFGGLSAYYHRIPVGHVEAGLRTGDRYAPFPEEMNRAMLGRLATWHFAPTRDAVRRLRNEGVDARAIHLTGNTIIDAMRWMSSPSNLKKNELWPWPLERGQKLVLVTCHRRENFGAPLEGVARAIARLADRNPNVRFLFPVHPNPAVKRPIQARLGKVENVTLTAPLTYGVFLAALRKAFLVLSDSGGVQEEATALGKTVLVLRDKTERAEGIRAGTLRLVGTDPSRIERECQRWLADNARSQITARACGAYGDGRAASRIVRILEKSLT